MMNAKEIANIWKEVVKIYNNTREINLPEKTMSEIVQSFGLEKTKEVFATVAAIKKHDGRIYGKNREYINSIPVDSENVEWRSGNPVVYAGLDDIHNSNITERWRKTFPGVKIKIPVDLIDFTFVTPVYPEII